MTQVLTPTTQDKLNRINNKFVGNADSKPVVTVASLAVKAVKDEMKDAFEQVFTAVRHCHFSVPHEQRQTILRGGEWFPTNLIDVYKDTPDMALLKDNMWFRIRNTTDYSFKTIEKDNNNVLRYFEMTGNVKDLQRWLLSRLLFTLKIVRYQRRGDDDTWVDFVAIEDTKGQTLYDCVATIHGDPPTHSEFTTPRCGSAFIAAKGLHIDGLVCDDSDCTQENASLERPPYWPEWKSPFPPVSDADRQNALAFAAAVRDEELKEDANSDSLDDEDI